MTIRDKQKLKAVLCNFQRLNLFLYFLGYYQFNRGRQRSVSHTGPWGELDFTHHDTTFQTASSLPQSLSPLDAFHIYKTLLHNFRSINHNMTKPSLIMHFETQPPVVYYECLKPVPPLRSKQA